MDDDFILYPWGGFKNCTSNDDCALLDGLTPSLCRAFVYDKSLGPGCVCDISLGKGGEGCLELQAGAGFVGIICEIPSAAFTAYYSWMTWKLFRRHGMKWKSPAGISVVLSGLALPFNGLWTISRIGRVFAADGLQFLIFYDLFAFFAPLVSIFAAASMILVGFAWLQIVGLLLNSKKRKKLEKRTKPFKKFLAALMVFQIVGNTISLIMKSNAGGTMISLISTFVIGGLYYYAGRTLLVASSTASSAISPANEQTSASEKNATRGHSTRKSHRSSNKRNDKLKQVYESIQITINDMLQRMAWMALGMVAVAVTSTGVPLQRAWGWFQLEQVAIIWYRGTVSYFLGGVLSYNYRNRMEQINAQSSRKNDSTKSAWQTSAYSSKAVSSAVSAK